MIDPTLPMLFGLAAPIMLVVPGPAVLHVVARSVDQGSLACTFGNWLKGNRACLRAQRDVTGGVFIALGVATAVTGQARK